MTGSFGVDHLRCKGAMSRIIPCPNQTRRGEVVEMRGWLDCFWPPLQEHQIPMSNKRKFHGPRPLRADTHPNGRLHLSFKDRQRVSLANKPYDLTSRLVEWAVSNGCIICVENLQCSFSWATTFWTSVAHLVGYAVFHSCQYGSARQKKTMIAFSPREFEVVNAVFKGQNSRHKHAKWGYNAKEKQFATSEETAYPMGLAKMFASCFDNALVAKGIAVPPETLEDIKDTSLQSLQQMRAYSLEPTDYLLLFQRFLQRSSCEHPHNPYLPSKFFSKSCPGCPKVQNYSLSSQSVPWG